MKEMIYSSGRLKECIVLFEGEEQGFRFKIVSYGASPCAYIEIPKSIEKIQ